MGVIAFVVLAGCTHGGRSRPASPGATPVASCPTTTNGDYGWQRVGALTGRGTETSVEVTGMVARGPGGPWLAVGAARTGEAPTTTARGSTTEPTATPLPASPTTSPAAPADGTGGSGPAGAATTGGGAPGHTGPNGTTATTAGGGAPSQTGPNGATATTAGGGAPGQTGPNGATATTAQPPSQTGPSGATATTAPVGQSPATTAPPGVVGVPAAGAALVPAVWSSNDGAAWRRQGVQAVSLDGAADRLLGVARYGAAAAAVGVTFNHNEGVARPSGWASRDGGPLQEAVANRELFGGPAGLGVSGVGAGPLGLAILGLRNGKDNHLFIAVWRSSDGRVWSPPVQDPALTARPAEAPAALGVAVGSNAIVVGGKTVQVSGPSDAVIWTGVPAANATGGMRWERVPPGPAGLGGAGAQEVDRVVWTSSGFVAAGLTGNQGRQQLVAWISRDGLDWSRGEPASLAGVSRLTSLAAGDGGLVATGIAGSTACLWRSTDGRSWTAEPLPPAAARPGGLQSAVAAADADRTVLIVQSQGRAEVWARPASGN
jgi:hypothetical protein